MSLLTWIGMVVDAMLKSTADKKASAIYRTILRQEGSALLDSILGPLALAVESGSTMHQSMDGIESKVIQLLTLAAKIWTCSNIPQEMPTREWLREYLLVTLGSGVYDAWEKKDLIWAIYNYFTWKKPEKTVNGVVEAIYDLAILAGLPKPADGSNVLPMLLSTYKALGLSGVAGVKNATVIDDAKKKYGDKPLATSARKGNEGDVKALLTAGYKDLEERNWPSDDTALINASYHGLEGAVKALLSAGADKDAKGTFGCTALIEAARQGHEGCVRLLVEAGADRRIRTSHGRGFVVPEYTALTCAKTEAIKKILIS